MNPVFNTQEVLAYAYAIQNKNNGYMKDTQRFSETNNNISVSRSLNSISLMYKPRFLFLSFFIKDNKGIGK